MNKKFVPSLCPDGFDGKFCQKVAQPNGNYFFVFILEKKIILNLLN